MDDIYDYKGLFWDHVSKKFYRWHELKELHKTRNEAKRVGERNTPMVEGDPRNS